MTDVGSEAAPVRFQDWRSLVVTGWETILKGGAVSPEFNHRVSRACGYEDIKSGLVTPIALMQFVLHAVIDHFWIEPAEGRTGLHAEQTCRILQALPEGKMIDIEGRVSRKFVRRSKRYFTLEARAQDLSGNLLMEYVHTIMHETDEEPTND